MVHASRLDRLSVGLSVCKVYCGKTADRIRMPFGMVSGVGRWRGVLDGGGHRRREIGSFGGEFGASCCNQSGHSFVVVREQRALLKLLWGRTCSCNICCSSLLELEAVA